jgi:hypothetical protein
MRGLYHFFAFVFFCFVAKTANSWGFLGHKTINRTAVFALPQELFGFYKKHIDFISAHSVDPDNRRYLFDDEGCKHFLDCDQYEKVAPLDTIPHNWFKAVEKYSEDSLKKHGIVPWHCMLMLNRLTKAFEVKDLQKILKTSADIGHYIADAHVPLHATGNYNGQRTNQEGIHALWESRIPQLYLDSFDLLTGTVTYLSNPQEAIWKAIGESYSCVDTVLLYEKLSSNNHQRDKYSFETIGRNTMEVYSPAFCLDYNFRMDKMVERRMKQAAYLVAAFWYTAWVNAGQPDLTNMQGEIKPEKLDEDAENARKSKPIKGREELGKD